MDHKFARSRSINRSSNINDKNLRKVNGAASGTVRHSSSRRKYPEVGGDREVKHQKKQIPKQLRYDLENALLGLCDVWFEEIKPHLISNQIKLHIGEPLLQLKKNTNTNDTNEISSCSHTDPAATSSNCELCRLLVAATNNIKHALSQAISSGASIDTSNLGPTLTP